MDNYDPLKTVDQLRTWIKKSFSSLNTDTVHVAEAKRRHREVMRAINQLEKLQFSISDDIISEKKILEELISTSDEKAKLATLSKELSSLARDINRQLRDTRSPRTVRGRKASPKILRVTLPDRTVICEKKSIDTFLMTLQYIGLERVSKLQSIISQGHPLVSTEKSESAKYFRELDGYFIGTHSSTATKARFIQRIARELHIKITVEVISVDIL